MNTHVMLPDFMGYAFIGFGVIAIVVYIIATIDDIKAARHEKAVRKFKAAVKTDKVSKALADYYTAAAYGDPDDFCYWVETAKKFMGD